MEICTFKRSVFIIRSLFRFARDRGISDNLLFCDTQLKNLYKIPKSGGYSYISENADLRLLIKLYHSLLIVQSPIPRPC